MADAYKVPSASLDILAESILIALRNAGFYEMVDNEKAPAITKAILDIKYGPDRWAVLDPPWPKPEQMNAVNPVRLFQWDLA